MLISTLAEPFPNSTIFRQAGLQLHLRSSCPHYKYVVLVNALFSMNKYVKRDTGATYHMFQKFITYNFITCDGLENQLLSFKAYVSPFQPMLWICIIVFFVCVWIFLSGLFRFINLKYNTPVTLLSVLLEQPISKAMSRATGIKILLASIYMMSVVLTNSYRGIVTTSLIVPVIPKTLETFDEALDQGYNFLQALPARSDQIYSVVLRDTPKRNIPQNNIHQVALDFLNNISNFNAGISEILKPNSSVDLKFRKKLKDITTRLRVPQNFPNTTTEMELSKCNKTIYVDVNDNLDQIIFDMKSSGQVKGVYKGKELFLVQRSAWRLGNIEWDQTNILAYRSQAIVHSGIEQYWDDWFNVRPLKESLRKFETADEGRAQPLSKKTLLSTFLIHFSMLFICFAIFILENFLMSTLVARLWLVENTMLFFLSQFTKVMANRNSLIALDITMKKTRL